MNIQTLKTELALPKYSAMTDQQAADDLNTADIINYQVVDYSDVSSYLSVKDKRLAIAESALESARTFMLDIREFKTFDLNKPFVKDTVTRRLDALIVDSLIDATDKAIILSLADGAPISRAQELGLGVVSEYYVNHARAN